MESEVYLGHADKGLFGLAGEIWVYCYAGECFVVICMDDLPRNKPPTINQHSVSCCLELCTCGAPLYMHHAQITHAYTATHAYTRAPLHTHTHTHTSTLVQFPPTFLTHSPTRTHSHTLCTPSHLSTPTFRSATLIHSLPIHITHDQTLTQHVHPHPFRRPIYTLIHTRSPHSFTRTRVALLTPSPTHELLLLCQASPSPASWGLAAIWALSAGQRDSSVVRVPLGVAPNP